MEKLNESLVALFQSQSFTNFLLVFILFALVDIISEIRRIRAHMTWKITNPS